MSATGAWWESATGYEVYLPSFADSDGDGWGDLRGVVEHLDYLVWLGVDVLWLTPFYESPMRDGGYDISDHRRVDDRYGGQAALAELITGAHARGLRVLADLVVNHTSSAHPWFQNARLARDATFRDCYIWRDTESEDHPPNNWLSHFGGPAWTHTPETGQSYLHLFSRDQPDLDWSNPGVVAAVDDIIVHWLELGIDGFRIDTAGYLAKDLELRDNPLRADDDPLDVTGATLAWRLQDHLYDIHRRETVDIHRHWRRIADRYGAVLVGEIYDLDPVSLARYSAPGQLHTAFWFGLVETGWDPPRIAQLLCAAAASPTPHAWTLGNHDRPRAASRFTVSLDQHRPTGRYPGVGGHRALAVHTALALLPGQLWIYQGDELGLTNAAVRTADTFDPLAGAAPEQGRAVSRAPMSWRPGPGNGFTTAPSAWLACDDRPDEDTVEVQCRDEASILNATRRLLTARRAARTGLATHPAAATRPTSTAVRIERGPITAIVNLAGEALPLRDCAGDLADAEVIFDTDHGRTPQQRGSCELAPWQARWYRTQNPATP